jgi:hypothetical protein
LVGFDLQKRDQENLYWMIKMLALSKAMICRFVLDKESGTLRTAVVLYKKIKHLQL